MTGASDLLAIAEDPLAQLIAEHPVARGEAGLLVLSQMAALLHWPRIEREAGPVTVILRRPGAEDPGAWRDQLAMLDRLIADAPREVRLMALGQTAAEALAAETGWRIDVLPALPRAFHGTRRLVLSRSDAGVQIMQGGAEALPAASFNLSRLRRVASIAAKDEGGDLTDLAAFANGAMDANDAPNKLHPVVLVVVPNGVGLGHVTRMMAVAKHLRSGLKARVVFWSFSRSVGILSQFGYESILRQTTRHLGADDEDWLRWETAEFAATLAALKPDLVVQDSHRIDRFVVDALARPGTGAARLALIRRGMWQPHHLGAEALASENLADLVIEPGDLAGAADRGVTRGRDARSDAFAEIRMSAPVTLTGPEDALSPRAAKRALGLGRGRHCLVSLGSDTFSDRGLFVKHLIEAARTARVTLVWGRSPLAAADPELADHPAILSRSVYPIAPHLAAFDGVVSAAGYNSFHELMQLCDRPVLFAPRKHSSLDDQAARATFAAAEGWARQLRDGPEDVETIAAFMEDLRVGRPISTRPAWRDGAQEIAHALTALIDGERARP